MCWLCLIVHHSQACSAQALLLSPVILHPKGSPCSLACVPHVLPSSSTPHCCMQTPHLMQPTVLPGDHRCPSQVMPLPILPSLHKIQGL